MRMSLMVTEDEFDDDCEDEFDGDCGDDYI